MGLLSFLVLVGIAYLVWRISDQLPDVVFRISEIQRDVAEIRRSMAEPAAEPASAPEPAPAVTASASAESTTTEGTG